MPKYNIDCLYNVLQSFIQYIGVSDELVIDNHCSMKVRNTKWCNIFQYEDIYQIFNKSYIHWHNSI